MSVATFDELKAEISDHLDRNDLDTKLDTFIRLAESRHERDVRIRQMLVRSTSSLGDRYLALPSGFLEMRTLRLLTDPVTVVEEINLHEMNRQRRESSGKPEWYTVHDDIEFDVVPDESYTVEMVYYAKFDALSDSNQSNALLERAPDVYLYGALIAAEPFLLHDERLSTWAQMYRGAVDTLNGMDKKRAGPLTSRVVGRGP